MTVFYFIAFSLLSVFFPFNLLFFVLKEASGSRIEDSLVVKDLSSDKHITIATIKDVFLFMGRELEQMESIPAGNVIGTFIIML